MKITNPPFGNMSGSLGGLTFRTQGNQTVVSAKKIGTPIKSKIQQQTSHIQIEVSNNWGALDELDKAGWDDFAIGSFKPRKKTNTGTASGYNAYFSLNATAKKLQLIQIPSVISSNEIVINEADTNNVYTEIKTPPNSPLTTTIATTPTTDNIQVALAGVERVEDTINFTLEITTTTSESYELEQPLQDSNGNPIAFTIYSSPAKKYASQKSNKKFNSILFSTSPILVATSPVVEGSIVLSVSINDLKNCVPANYNLDKFIDLGLCICSTTGMLQYVNNLTIKVRDIFGELPEPTGDPTIIFCAYSEPLTNVYNTKTKAFTEIDFGITERAKSCAISEKYIVIGDRTAQTSGSSIQIYNRETEEFVNLEITIASTITKVFIDDDTLYIKTNFVGQTYSYFARFNLITGSHMSCPSIDKVQIESVVFSDDTIFLSGEPSMYLSYPFMMIDKLTGNNVTTVFPVNKRTQQVLIDETRKYVILIDYSFTLSNVKIYSYETGNLLHTTTIPKYFWGAVVKDNKVWLMSLYLAPNTPDNNFTIDLDTFAIAPFGQTMMNETTLPFLSDNNLFAGHTSPLTGNSGLLIFDEEENLWSYSTNFIDQKVESIAGIP